MRMYRQHTVAEPSQPKMSLEELSFSKPQRWLTP